MSTYEELVLNLLIDPPDRFEKLPLANRSGTLYGTTITFLVVSWIAVIFRLWVRFKVLREPGWDDVFVFASAVCNTAVTACLCLSVQYGFGKHMLYIGVKKLEHHLQIFYIEHSIYVTGTALIKISLLLQYLRIFKAGYMRRLCISILVAVSVWGVAFSIAAWFPCFPVRGWWDRSVVAKCYGFGFANVSSFVGTFEAHSASNMVFDITIFLLPMCLFSNPDLRPRNALAMAGLFSFGSIVIAAAAWRLYGVAHTRAATYPYIDFTWWSPPFIIVSALEVDLAIICASMPVFWPTIEKSVSAIFVSFEVQVVEERVNECGLSYELEHTSIPEGSLKSGGTSTHELRGDKGSRGDSMGDYTVGVNPLNEDANTYGPRTEIQSRPKPRWVL